MPIDATAFTEVYTCVKCNFKYRYSPGPQDPCQRCGSLYFKWNNYADKRFFDKEGKPRAVE